MNEVQTFPAYEGALEDDAPRPEILLSRHQRDALADFAGKFGDQTIGLAAMGSGYVHDEHGMVAGEKLYPLGS